jgi:hypothetical protein
MDNFEMNQQNYDRECIDCQERRDALDMAEIAGIELNDMQINDYIKYRRDKELDMSDKQLLHVVLTSYQKDLFERAFWKERYL